MSNLPWCREESERDRNAAVLTGLLTDGGTDVSEATVVFGGGLGFFEACIRVKVTDRQLNRDLVTSLGLPESICGFRTE